MVKQLSFVVAGPILFCCVEQIHGPDHICIDKIQWRMNGPVYVRLCREMNDMGDLMLLKYFIERLGIEQVGYLEMIVWEKVDVGQIFEISGVGQSVQVDNAVIRILFYKQP